MFADFFILPTYLKTPKLKNVCTFFHSEDTKYPEGTSEWLKKRNWINAHYHIKCPRRMSSRKTKYTKILNGPPPDVHSDFSRMAR